MHLLSRSRVGLAAAGTALVLLVSACGSSSDSSSPSTEAAATTTAPAADGSATTNAGGGNGQAGRGAGMQEAITAFTDCLTQQGISVPDVSIGGGRGNGATPGNGSFPTGSFPADGRAPGGDGGPPADGSFPGGAPDGSFPANGRGGGNGGNFDFTTMIVERLGLDTSDATVKAAVDACSSTLTSAFPNGGGAPGGQAPTTTTA